MHARERELRAANRQLNDANNLLSTQSRTDPLTGLANRLCLREDFAHLASRSDHGYCLILIDLDRFKDYNDDHGHQAGDLVLAQAADVINETARANDRSYRYGGEELLIVLRDQGPDAGLALAERHRVRVQGADLPHFLNHPHGVVTLSAGVAASTPGETPEQVLRRADEAPYEAKANGRNQTAVSEFPDPPAVTARGRTPATSPAPS